VALPCVAAGGAVVALMRYSPWNGVRAVC